MDSYRRRRAFLIGSVAALALTQLPSCMPIPAGRHGDGVERERFNPLRDYSAEPHRVRLINRDRFGPDFYPTMQQNTYGFVPGSVVVETEARELYLLEQGGMSRRYPIAVGDQGYAWKGQSVIGRKAQWPAWYPTPSMRQEVPSLPTRIAPGEENPLGARALYLYQHGADTLYRIHGTSEPWTIGTGASSGCIRMFNEDVIDLFDRVSVGALVVVV